MSLKANTNRPFAAILVFLLIWLMCAVAFTGLALLSGMAFFGQDVVTSGMAATESSEGLAWLRYNQFLGQIGIFVLPSFIFAIVAFGIKGFVQGLGMATRTRGISWGAAMLLMIASVPIVNILLELNMGMDLPDSMQGIEDWMRRQEDAAIALSSAFLDNHTVSGLLLNILIVALLPAFGEELLFRASLQPLFIRLTGNPHVGILLSAIAFSALHMQFFGFLPRLFLGFVLGYAFYWTKNLWVPVAMHLLNNLTIVVYSWTQKESSFETDGEVLSNFDPTWALLSSVVLMAVSVYVLISQEKEKARQ